MLMYYSSANFIVWVWLKGKSCKMFDSIMSTKLCFFLNFNISWEGAKAFKPPTPGNGCSAFIFFGSSWQEWLWLTIDWEAVPMHYVQLVTHTQLYIGQDSSLGVVNGLKILNLKTRVSKLRQFSHFYWYWKVISLLSHWPNFRYVK